MQSVDINKRLKSYVGDKKLQTADFWTDTDNVYGLNFDGSRVELFLCRWRSACDVRHQAGQNHRHMGL